MQLHVKDGILQFFFVIIILEDVRMCRNHTPWITKIKQKLNSPNFDNFLCFWNQEDAYMQKVMPRIGIRFVGIVIFMTVFIDYVAFWNSHRVVQWSTMVDSFLFAYTFFMKTSLEHKKIFAIFKSLTADQIQVYFNFASNPGLSFYLAAGH